MAFELLLRRATPGALWEGWYDRGQGERRRGGPVAVAVKDEGRGMWDSGDARDIRNAELSGCGDS